MLRKREPEKKPRIPSAEPSNSRFFHEIEALSKALAVDSNRHRRRRSLLPDPDPKPSPSSPKDRKKNSSSSSIWNWKPLKALTQTRHRRFDCRFSLHVHSIESIPSSLAGAALVVHWRRSTDAAGAQTRPAKVFHGSAEFEETLAYRCSVYGSRSGHHNSAKYEPRDFVIFVTVVGAPGLDLGKHRVDLTRILPLTLEELEGEKGSGKWSTSFRLSGRARGASLNVSFGFSVESAGDNQRVSEVLDSKRSGIRRAGSVRGLPTDYNARERHRGLSRSVEDVKVLREVIKKELDALPIDSKPEFEFFSGFSEPAELKCCKLSEATGGDGESESESDEPEFTVIEQGVEIANKEQINEPLSKNYEMEKGVEVVGSKIDRRGDEKAQSKQEGEEGSLPIGDWAMEDLDLGNMILPSIEVETSCQLSYNKAKSNYRAGIMKSKSLSLDDATESVASEFLSMLGLKSSSGSDTESPRERLWQQFEKESLTGNNSLFSSEVEGTKESYWQDFSEDYDDLSSLVCAAETELHKETLAMKSKSRAQMLEDEETEALMHEWGLNEKAFENSPPEIGSGFGSPIEISPEEPIELPPLGENLGPVIQTKDGGFLRSMSASLFKNSKTGGGGLVMQSSNPLVVPAEMGSDIMEILQGLASVGIEKLSMQASKLMPLEDITGKTMEQVAWEATPNFEREDFLRLESEPVVGQNGSTRIRKGKGLKLDSSRSEASGSEYVSLDDLAPLAMDKIEALSIEGLRVQSGMSDEDAPSNISPQYIAAKNSCSLGFEGAAGLQLMDIKDNGDNDDGLMGLSITLDEWMRLDSGVVDEEDQISERMSKILAAHHAKSTDFSCGEGRTDKRGGKSSGRRWGLLGNNFTVALMVQLRDPLRNYEPVGTPMLALIQVERVFVPPKPKVYSTVSEKGNSEQDDESETEPVLVTEEEKKVVENVIPQFKITEVHVAGLKTEPGRKKGWGNSTQQQSGSRWLLAGGMGKSNKHSFMKSNPVTRPSQVTTKVQPGDTLWSISSRVHGTGAKWKELAALNPHIRNPNVILPNETIRLC